MSSYIRFAPLNFHQSTLDSSSNHSCSDGVQWIWTVLGDCAVTTREQISAYVGLISMVTWMMVGIPQIIKNFRNIDGMAGISFLLLFQWTAGDTTNLIGAILTNQLKPQIYLAVFFVMSDTVLLVQYLIFYVHKIKRKRENERAISAASRAILCVMGMASFTQFFTNILTSYSTFDAASTYSKNTKDIVGYAIGCVSSIFYLGSRTSQIYTNYKNKSTEGLAVMMFVLAVFGNITYGGQILIQDLHGEFILEHTPWIIGSLGVIGLDVTLLWQFHHYKNRSKHLDEARRSLIHHEDCVINADPSVHQSPESRRAEGFTDSLY